MKKMVKSSVSILLIMTMIVSLFTIVPITVSAASGVSYIERSWDSGSKKVVETIKTCSDYTELSNRGSDTLTSGWYVVSHDTTINRRLYIEDYADSVNIIICDNATLTCPKGIEISGVSELNIYGQSGDTGKIKIHPTSSSESPGNKYALIEASGWFNFYGGKLEVEPGTGLTSYDGAAIGGRSNNTSGRVNIYGGEVNATTHFDGAAIGGGYKGGVGQVRIYGGTVKAKGSTAAPIGNGIEGNSNGSIEIYGGTVTAESYNFSAAIGGSDGTDGPAITISGGTVNAYSYHGPGSGAAIGSGRRANRTKPIRITGGSVLAKSTDGAAIGAGYEASASNIDLSGGIIVATAAAGGAGIGGGSKGNAADIKISGAHVNASSSSYLSASAFVSAIDKWLDTISFYTPGGDNSLEALRANAAIALELFKVKAIALAFSDEESGCGIGAGYEGTFSNITISDGSNVTASSGSYAAAIGSGDENSNGGGTITISDSTVTATAGTDAAGIGTGNECDSACDAINITNSTVTANGGRYAAGIGGGDAVSGGTINITNSTIKEAKSGTDGAGIGGGESGNGGNITIKDSTVTAHGGGYAAGIGGGDAGDGGNITIDNSTVKAYGGTDAAGIGGGEDGNGGHIEIINGSDVYAKGKEYGAGIGGGEDASGNYCKITSDSTVEAVSGGDGNVQSIGHGDCGWYVSSYTGGSISLGNSCVVYAGSNSGSTEIYYGNDRFSAIRNNKYAKITPCTHPSSSVHYENPISHNTFCDYCGEKIGDSKKHNWDDSYHCTVCGCESKKTKLTLVEQDNNGEVNKEIEISLAADYYLPVCENVPDGMEFVCWDYLGGYGLVPGDKVFIQSENLRVKAVYVPIVDTYYVDAEGVSRAAKARRLSSEKTALSNMIIPLTEGWYVLEDDTEFGMICIRDNVNLILADGATMTFSPYFENEKSIKSIEENTTLKVYGQKLQTGAIECTEDRDVDLNNFEQYGGNINAPKFQPYDKCILDGGTLRVQQLSADEFIFGGGTAEIDYVETYVQNINLRWTKANDSFRIDDVWLINSVTIADGQSFKDEQGNVYTGVINVNNILGKTLTPNIPHDYAAPEWAWDNEYREATAVFRCKDCDNVQEIKAKVTYEDSGRNRTSTARCTFYGEEFTTTQTFRILFDVTLANVDHGTVTANKATAKADDYIKLEITPDDGYALSKLYYTDTEGNKTEIDGSGFTMPESDVTVTAEFAFSVPAKEPYIDNNGEYHLGNIEHFEIDGKNYAVNEDGTVGDELESVELSYFDFALLEDNTYQINYYTGPTENLTTLVIPKTFNDKPITVLGNDKYEGILKEKVSLPEVVLNENIVTITDAAFNKNNVEKVSGDTSNLRLIGEFAFGKAEDGAAAIDVTLDYHDSDIELGGYSFNERDVIFRIKHLTTFSGWNPMAESITFIFTDDHTYGEPEWTWADDYSSASATFICTDPRCEHEETVKASVSKSEETSKTFYTATVEFEGEPYTNVKTVDKVHSAVTIADTTNGMVTADKSEAYVGEEVTLTITPDTGYKLNTLIVKDANNHEVSLSGNKFTMPDCDVTVTATFAANDYTITYNIGENGSVSGVHSANIGNEIELTITPNGGYELDTLSVRDSNNSEIDVTGNKFTMPAGNVTVEAVFKKTDYTITYVVSEHGSVSGNTTAQFNDEVTLTVTPDDGYAIMWVSAVDERGGEYNVEIIDNILYMPDANVTVSAEFIKTTPAKEPYIDSDGAYHLGNIEYVTIDGNNHEVKDDRYVGGQLESVDVSYFDFKLINGDSSYQINYYTGPTENLSELVIPKSFNGKPVTVLGNDINYADNSKCRLVPQGTPSFTLVLNENITEIKPYTFYAVQVTNVTGNTSNLSRIGEYAFSWANSRNGYVLDIQLDYPGRITTGAGIFNHMNVTARIKHATTFSRSSFGQHLIAYVFTDAHTYGAPAWSWSEDNTSATATFTCTDSRCKHGEIVEATITSGVDNGKNVRVATVEFEGKSYSDTKEISYFSSHSLSLNGNIGVNFYLNLTDQEIADSAVVDFVWTVNGSQQTHSVTLTVADRYPCGYKASCPIAVAEMTYEITATLRIGGDMVATDSYSAQQYANVILTDENFKTTYIEQKGEEKYKQLVALVQTMLDYGSKAQIRFDRNTDNLANGGTDFFTEEVTFTSGASNMDEYLSDCGLEYVGTSVVYLTETTLRHYYRIVDASKFTDEIKSGITFDGEAVAYGERNGMIYFDKKDIAASQLDIEYVLSINGHEYHYSALDYSALAYSLDDKPYSESITKQLAASVYRYNQAANVFFNN